MQISRAVLNIKYCLSKCLGIFFLGKQRYSLNLSISYNLGYKNKYATSFLQVGKHP